MTHHRSKSCRRSRRAVVAEGVSAAFGSAAIAAGSRGFGVQAAVSAQPSPRRIISLVPAVTEMLFALGAGDRVVARQQLRPVSAGGREAAARRRAARSRSRADHLAAAGSRHRLRQPDRSAQRSSNARRCRSSSTVTRGWPTSRRRSASSAIASAAASARASWPARSSAASRLCASASPDSSGRGRCWSSGERLARCAASTPAAARASSTTWSTLAGGDNVFADIEAAGRPGDDRADHRATPDVIIELRADPLAPEQLTREVGGVEAARLGARRPQSARPHHRRTWRHRRSGTARRRGR